MKFIEEEKYKDLSAGEETEDEYAVAGRIMAMRNTGMFIDLMDETGRIQIFSHKQNLGEEKFKMLKLVDVGDIIGFKGTIRRTPRGELSIKATEYTVLTKALLPLPEKFHGLTDVETKYRQRYVDLIVNETTRDTFRKRSKIISKIREFLGKQGYLEVETPILQTVASGAAVLSGTAPGRSRSRPGPSHPPDGRPPASRSRYPGPRTACPARAPSPAVSAYKRHIQSKP